jgi:glucokinase
MEGKRYVVGVDIGGTDIKYALLDADGKMIGKTKAPTEAQRGPAQVCGAIAQVTRELLAQNGVELALVSAIGVGSPGLIDSVRGIVREPPNLPGWKNAPLKDLLEDLFDQPVFVNNDANAAAYGEFWVGAARDVNSLVMFTLGTGIGGGIILDGRLYSGVDGSAGEVGHVIIDPNGPLCGCGHYGCLEALAAAPAVVRRAHDALESHPERRSLLRDIPRAELTSKKVHQAATRGDQLATEILADVGKILGIAAANMINLLNPEMIVYSGAMIGAGDYIFAPLRKTAQDNSFRVPWERVRIEIAQLGADAGCIGAAGLALASLKS